MIKLDEILEKCLEETPLSDEEIACLLTQREEKAVEEICLAARTLRQRYFGNRVFLYGFVYFSTYCKNACAFCFYRNSNENPPRYRKKTEEILETADQLKRSGVHLIDLTMGEDPWYDAERLCRLVREVKEEVRLPLMISPGVVEEGALAKLAQAGADWYALYQETHNPQLFQKLRLGQSFETRMRMKRAARRQGFLIEEGILTGVGDDVADTVQSFRQMESLGAQQVRAMTFVPQAGTPMDALPPQGFERELLDIAVMRLLFPDVLIPASLDVEGSEGLKRRLWCGANTVTSLIPPKKGFAGVANAAYAIDDGRRTVEGIRPILRECGMQAASLEEYQDTLKRLRAR